MWPGSDPHRKPDVDEVATVQQCGPWSSTAVQNYKKQDFAAYPTFNPQGGRSERLDEELKTMCISSGNVRHHCVYARDEVGEWGRGPHCGASASGSKGAWRRLGAGRMLRETAIDRAFQTTK